MLTCRHLIRALLACALAALPLGLSAALAEQVVIQRNVTVREGPSRQAAPLTFPSVGTRLELLDNGRRVRGYYRVRLPDGREGWVYYTFVRREADSAQGFAAAPEWSRTTSM